MTDTPRTEAELLAIFADQNSGAIEPQDMRDMVESVVSPVAGGGLGVAVGSDEVALSLVTTPGGSTFADPTHTFSLPSGAATPLPMGVRSDPRGWVIGSSFASVYQGFTIPADCAVQLPQGIYLGSSDIIFHTSPAAVRFWWDWTEDVSAADAVYGNPGYFFTPFHGMGDDYSATMSRRDICVTGQFRVTKQMEDAGVRIFPQAYQTTGSPILFDYWDYFITRVA